MITRTIIDGKEWVKVIHLPRLKVLRGNLFGLTLGLTASLTHLIFAPPAQVAFFLLLDWFLIGYLFGILFALFYNALVFLYLKIFYPEFVELWFYCDPAKQVNIIKTPIPDRDWDPPTQRLYKEAEFKVFDFQPYDKDIMKNPYTIVFVANPLIESRGSDVPQRDPIMDNDNLFLKAIERALFNFEYNHGVIGSPDIWSKIRIVTINPSRRHSKKKNYVKDDMKDALVGEFGGTFEAAGAATHNNMMLRPTERLVRFVRKALEDEGLKHIECIDVIFALSASNTHDRSTADPTSFRNQAGGRHLQGELFTFSSDPYCQKGDEILKNDCEQRLCQGGELPDGCEPSTRLPRGGGGPDRILYHEYFPPDEGIGLVAMSVLDVRDKLPVHEFAHAMSSVENGKIVDEYYDYAQFQEDAKLYNPLTAEVYSKEVLINRIYRNPDKMKNNHSVKVHNIFARYNGNVYESDRQHHSARQGWFSYFPERRQREILCTMDAAQDVFEFDELLRDFMYDRLCAKVNRDFPK